MKPTPFPGSGPAELPRHSGRDTAILAMDGTPAAGTPPQEGRRVPRPPRHTLAFALLALLPWPSLAPAAEPATQPGTRPAPLAIGTLADALRASAFTPDRAPGANDWNCVPPPAHPRPVVLVHGTLANMGFAWATLAPTLKNAGYCVYALNYGHNAFSVGERVGGLTDIAASAGELQTFIARVLAATGAAQVDIVGHSQGGLLPHYYLKRLGGAAQVHTLVGLGPSNHGTSVSGLLNLIQQVGLLNGFNAATATTPSLSQQEAGSAFMTALFADGDTVPGPRYIVIATTKDLIVTPYTQSFLTGPQVRNITIQDQCPQDHTRHLTLPYDGPTIQNVMNVLGANDPEFTAECRGYGDGDGA